MILKNFFLYVCLYQLYDFTIQYVTFIQPPKNKQKTGGFILLAQMPNDLRHAYLQTIITAMVALMS